MGVMIEPHVADNYRRLKDERGLSWAQFAEQMGPQDRHLASWMREQSTREDTAADKPRGRRSQLPMDQA